ncbi:hypothetical protein [Candidatus Electronema sp. JC]|uniref:hypothetical protein n=1 Tax=Candidatus Electronema sp. JC TaxID=3401570 RepID=UPI003B42D74D
MEDYNEAFRARRRDANELLQLNGHKIAAFHLGGVAVECRLKAFLVLYHKVVEWEQPSGRRKDSCFKQPVKNPGHGLLTAIKRMSRLYDKAKLDYMFLKHLEKVTHPLGASSMDYIGIRYIAETATCQDEWINSFDYVCRWLDKNKGDLL